MGINGHEYPGKVRQVIRADDPGFPAEYAVKGSGAHASELFAQHLLDICLHSQLVSLYNDAWRHYVTVTKIDGEWITFLDSDVPKDTPPEKMAKRKKVSEILSRVGKGNSVALTWFSHLGSPQDMEKAYPGLKYDKKTGYSYGIADDLKEGALKKDKRGYHYGFIYA